MFFELNSNYNNVWSIAEDLRRIADKIDEGILSEEDPDWEVTM